ncbi:hypothetical protein [Chitinimonas naiadis]
MNMHWEQAAREALALVPLEGASEEIRAKVEAVLATPLKTAPRSQTDVWIGRYKQLRSGNLAAATKPERAPAEAPRDERAEFEDAATDICKFPRGSVADTRNGDSYFDRRLALGWELWKRRAAIAQQTGERKGGAA